jgi:hypothetical protein
MRSKQTGCFFWSLEGMSCRKAQTKSLSWMRFPGGGTSMIGNSQGKTEVSLDLAE